MCIWKRLTIVAAVLCAGVLLTGCGSGSSSGTKAKTTTSADGLATTTQSSSGNPVITPASISVTAGSQTIFTATGGSAPYSFSVFNTNVTGAAINATTGVFTASATAGTVNIMVQDASGGRGYAMVTIIGSAPAQGVLKEFYTPGTQTITIPNGVTRVYVTVLGGGGGAARNQCTSGVTCFYGSGGGGGGGLAQGYVTVVPGTTYPLIVGAGGDTGAAGGTSRFNGNSIYATGGQSGAPYTAGSDQGGAGGQGYNGTSQNISGYPGSAGITSTTGVSAYGTGGGGYNNYGAGHSGGAAGTNLPGQGGFVVIYY